MPKKTPYDSLLGKIGDITPIKVFDTRLDIDDDLDDVDSNTLSILDKAMSEKELIDRGSFAKYVEGDSIEIDTWDADFIDTGDELVGIDLIPGL